MWVKALQAVLTRGIRQGRLHVRFADGTTVRYGAGTGPEASVAIVDPTLPRRILLNPQMALGEGYMEGGLTFPSDDDLRAFLQIAAVSAQSGRLPAAMRLARRVRIAAKGLMQWNTLAASQRRVQHHYDIPDAFYRLFMEETLQYTCAYYQQDDQTLEAAQAAKMAHIAAKLGLRPGLRVLDIGCGWGDWRWIWRAVTGCM